MLDRTQFHRASRDIWEAMAAGWDSRHAYFERTARPVTERMLEHARPAAGDTVLDLAAGTGVVGFAAAAQVGADGRVIVSDFAEAMVRVAEAQAKRLGIENVECRVLDAERLELPDDSADVVLCRWGYMLMADPAAALAETRRVLRPGGRLALAVFGDPARNPWAAVPSQVLRERGHMPPPESGAPGILALADQERLRALVVGAGFPPPRIDEVPFVFRFADMDDFWDFLNHAAGAIAMVLERLDAGERASVREAIAEQVAAGEQGEIALPALSLVAAV